MAKEKKKEPAVWGATAKEKWFESLVDGAHAVTGLELEKGGRYLIPENAAGREIFRPSSSPVKNDAKEKEE